MKGKSYFLAQGFTLIELIVVLIVMGILAGTTASMISDRSAFDERIAYDQTMALLRNARMYAATVNCSIGVNESGQALFLTKQAICGTGEPVEESCDEDVCVSMFANNGADLFVHRITLPDSVVLSTNGLPFYFSPYGKVLSSLGGSTINPVITLGEKTINIVGQTGFINEP